MSHGQDNEEGPPCRYMEPLIQRTVDERASRLTRWYVLSHAARCGRCNRFLKRLRETVKRLRQAKASQPDQETLSRLASGAWRDQD